MDIIHAIPHLSAWPYAAALGVLLLTGAVYGKTMSSSKTDLLVKWGRDRISIPLPDVSITLTALKKDLADRTGLAINQFKLVHGGAVLKGDNPVSAYGLKPGSTLTLIGSATPAPTARDTSVTKPTLPRTQEGVLVTIKTELDHVHDKIHPGLEKFLNTLAPAEEAQEPRMVNPSDEDLQQEHARLGELLLQSLLRLDAITPESEWEDARKARKAAVKEVQSDLDKLDASWKASRATVPAVQTSPAHSTKPKSKRRR